MNGMDDNEDETNFSDDDLDALPANALVELEQNAIQSTQQYAKDYPQHDPFTQASNRYDGRIGNALAPQKLQPGYEEFDTEHFDAGLFDDAGIATPVEEAEEFTPSRPPGEMIQRESWRQARHGQRPHHGAFKQAQKPVRQHYVQQAGPRDSGYVDQGRDIEMQDSVLLYEQPRGGTPPLSSNQELAFRAQIADLLRERDKLTTQLQSINSTLMTQRGEIAIVRLKQSKESMIHQREIATLKKSHDEDAARYKAEIEAANEEARRIISEKQFLQRELEEEEGKTKALQRSLKEKEKAAQADGQISTPGKAKIRPLGDGFEDGEIMAISPVKSGRGSKSGTPTAGGKRKRKVDNASPMAPLVLLPSAPEARHGPQSSPEPEKPRIVVRKDPTAEKNLRFMQRILNHPIPTGQERIIEKFTQFAFPSQTSRPFSSIVLEATAGMSGDNIPSDLLQVFISLWSRALKEKYHKPIPLLVDIVQFVIALDSSVLNQKVIRSLLPVLQGSAEINGMIHFHNSPAAHENLNRSKQKAKAELNEDVDGTACLDILYSVACTCLHDEEKIDRFWGLISVDFVLLFLQSCQPICDTIMMLNLLSTSILTKTFGNVCGTSEDQAAAEKYIVNRVTYLLWDIPRGDQAQQPQFRTKTLELRIEAMALLTTLALSSPHPHDDPNHHGSLLLAKDPKALGRLFRCMYDELDALYAHGPHHEQHALLVNQATRLVYRLLELHGNTIDIQQKLLAINGAVHKHRVVLTRLAFSEGVFLDAGITDETVMMAHDMLEDAVTPEEAEALLEVFPSYKRRRDDTQG
jgi:hypothetical protein